jgi:hypothetical protein
LRPETRAVQRDIDDFEIAEAVMNGEVIEEYPEDKYGPSCLVSGITRAGRHLHVHVSCPPGVKVITVYEPSTEKWHEGLKTRKRDA